MTTEKVTLTLPTELMQEMRAEASPRGLSKLVAQAIEEYLEAKRKKQREEEMIAGYKATYDEMLALHKEWEPTDLADWQRFVAPYPVEEEDKHDTASTSR